MIKNPDFNNPAYQQALRDLNEFERRNPGWVDEPEWLDEATIKALREEYTELWYKAQRESGLGVDSYEKWEAQAEQHL